MLQVDALHRAGRRRPKEHGMAKIRGENLSHLRDMIGPDGRRLGHGLPGRLARMVGTGGEAQRQRLIRLEARTVTDNVDDKYAAALARTLGVTPAHLAE